MVRFVGKSLNQAVRDYLHKLSLHDALIVEAAARAGCAELLSEDMHAGAVISGVRIVNPVA